MLRAGRQHPGLAGCAGIAAAAVLQRHQGVGDAEVIHRCRGAGVADDQPTRPRRAQALRHRLVERQRRQLVGHLVQKNAVDAVPVGIAPRVGQHIRGGTRGRQAAHASGAAVAGVYVAQHLATGSTKAADRPGIVAVQGSARTIARIHDRGDTGARCRRGAQVVPVVLCRIERRVKIGRHQERGRGRGAVDGESQDGDPDMANEHGKAPVAKRIWRYQGAVVPTPEIMTPVDRRARRVSALSAAAGGEACLMSSGGAALRSQRCRASRQRQTGVAQWNSRVRAAEMAGVAR